MEYVVSLEYGGNRRELLVSAESHYDARVQALDKFLEEFKIPGTPVEYLTEKKGIIDVSVHKALDRRSIPRVYPQTTFFVDHIERLRKQIRESELTPDKKRKVTKLLLDISEVLNG